MKRRSNEIPNDLVADILFRLPSATVLRFKVVSKTWYALISDPYFIKIHSNQVSRNPKILLSMKGSQLCQLDYESPSENYKTVRPLNLPRDLSVSGPCKFIGSSFGLVCVANDRGLHIWNPTTRESVKILDIYRGKVYMWDFVLGFGYDSVSIDFMVVILLRITELLTVYCVYSLKTKSSKYIESPFQYYYDPWKILTSLVINGVIHCVMGVPNEFDPHIIAFDLAKKTFRKLQIPDEKIGQLGIPAKGLYKARGTVTLLEHKGCLCLFWSRGVLCEGKEIWMMKEYGDHTSWIHLLTISGAEGDISPAFLYKPLCITSKNEVFVQTAVRLIRWSSKEASARCVWEMKTGYISENSFDVYGVTMVDETLISPRDIMARKVANRVFRGKNAFSIISVSRRKIVLLY